MKEVTCARPIVKSAKQEKVLVSAGLSNLTFLLQLLRRLLTVKLEMDFVTLDSKGLKLWAR